MLIFTKELSVEKIDVYGEEGWVNIPNHVRNKYKFLEAIAESIQITGCDPIKVTVSNQGLLVAGPSGVNRLQAVIKVLKWTAVPALICCEKVPAFIDDYEVVASDEQLRSYFSRRPKRLKLVRSESGKVLSYDHYSGSLFPDDVRKNWVGKPDTVDRMYRLAVEERRANGTIDEKPYDSESPN